MLKMSINKSTLGGDAVRLTISKVITLCITMVTTMLLSRFRTLEEYGTYSQILMTINLFASIFMLGLPNSVNYFLGKENNYEERKKFLSVYYSVTTILSILLGLALVCAVPLIEEYFKNSEIHCFIYFLAIYPWANIISSSIENVLVVYQKTTFLMIYRFINSFFLLGSVVVVQIVGLGFKEYMVCNLVVYSLFAVSVYYISFKLSGGIKIIFDKKLIKDILFFSIPLGFASIIGTLSLELDKLLIGRLLNTSELAVYTNSAKELPVTIVASSITAVLLPRLASMLKDNKREEAIVLWNTATELAFIVIAVIVSGVFTYANEVMELLYSSKYLSGVPVFRVYTLVLVLRVTYFGIVLNALGKTKEIMYCSIGALVLNAILNPLFYLIMGIIGPAVATFVSIFFISMLQLYLTSKSIGIMVKKIFPWVHFLQIVVINFALGIVFFFLKKWLSIDLVVGDVVESLALGVLWSSIYFLFMKSRIIELWNTLNTK